MFKSVIAFQNGIVKHFQTFVNFFANVPPRNELISSTTCLIIF
jgi:hypothetical protein